ncbi:MAG: hypothetical protein ACTSXH_05675 [Promethearchaeota archaeon]
MIDCWKELNPKFIISNGRTGTRFLSHFFNTLSNEIDAQHEPSPSILKLRYQFGTGKFSLEKAIKKFKRERFELYTSIQKPIYIESNPGLSSLIPVIRKVFSSYKIIHIVRDGRDWVRSTINRGIYSSKIDRSLTPMLPLLRLFAPNVIKKPKIKNININAYLRDIWRFRALDFKKDPYYKKWPQMSQFEKNTWLWNKIDDSIYQEIKDDPNAKTVKFEDIFNKEKKYQGINEIINFFELKDLSKSSNLNIDEFFSKKINISPLYSFPNWKLWDDTYTSQFNEIAGEKMKNYEYF